MRYKKFGNTGLFVSELCLGTMTFGGEGELWSKIGALQQEDANRLVGRALEAGVNFIDTADVYSEGRSEIITGQALRDLKVARDDVVIATKVFGQTGPGVNARGNSRFHIMESVKKSLARLQLDHIDLYQIHGFDPATPIEETVRALDNLVQHGHVRYVGVSNWAAWQIMKGRGHCERPGRGPGENQHADKTHPRPPPARARGAHRENQGGGRGGWSPLAGGLLSGKYSRDGQAAAGDRRAQFDFPPVDHERAFDSIDVLRQVAEARGVSVAQVALAWLLHQRAVTSVIIGAKRVEQLDDNLAATDIRLTAQELAALDQVSALPPEYPGWMFTRQGEFRRQQLRESNAA
ncbi:aldo/keto reductase [Achromobacter ruhlandii]|uniref:aldo/keto reductase n=1 Tax=Achromobacter ruhlandii TaxID=72557 RepID=UPI0022B91301|nr:aldo/keto reductase [Achromobacter ruhlandii]MCZ8398340.1 aldo/keto reductase [Achromobacter ruhlandii]